METRKRRKKSTRKKRISKSARNYCATKKRPRRSCVSRRRRLWCGRGPQGPWRGARRAAADASCLIAAQNTGNPFETGLDRNPANYQSLTPAHLP